VLSLPSGFSREGLPVSISLAARHFEEPLLIQAGHAYEQANDWHKRRPQL
jgi:Asp-tRNA(Asn)/Glu-tRNA(Gln) amidotransferase A subunit family amidase